MSAFVKTFRTVRNNWKKSLFGFAAVSYGSLYAKDKYETKVFMRAMCEEAVKYGEEKIEPDISPRTVTVILNPAANRRSAKADFEKYCEPLLNLAGIMVNVVTTKSDGGARDIVENLGNPDAVIVAGGDGTLSEVITGLLRKEIDLCKLPIGILPLGRTNTVGNKLFPKIEKSKKGRVKQLTTATMAIIKGDTQYKDAMKVEALEAEKLPGKPIYALASIEWGAYRDILSRRDKYWYFGPWREYASYLFNGFKDSITWNCSGTLIYSPPCSGCQNCAEAKPVAEAASSSVLRRLFMSGLVSKSHSETGIDYKHVENADCLMTTEVCFKVTDLTLTMSDLDGIESDGVSHLNVKLGTPTIKYLDFVNEGWGRVNGQNPKASTAISVRRVELQPKDLPENEGEIFYSIDSEDLDIKPIRVTIMPRAILMYCKRDISLKNNI